jgi:hypothetical protein
LSEGDAGTTSFDFTVTLSNLSDETVTVDYATSDGTATAGEDYTAVTTTTLTFNPGDLTKPVSILVNGDTKYEVTETFNVDLTNASNSTISDALGLGTINNDDSQPTITIDDVTLSEGDAGTTSFDFTVTLSNLSDETVTVDYATSDGTATVADNDYTAVTTTTLTFNPGDLTKPVSVLVNGDTKNEANETFNVDLTNASNGTIGDNLGLGTINNDDVAVTVSIDDVTLSEGDAGTTSFNFTVSLSAVSGQTVTVDYATSDGTATVADNDYTAVTTTTLAFNPGDLTKPVSISVNGDTKYETNETFNVDLTNPVNATISDNLGLGTITNDDAQPTITIDDVTLSEGSKTSFGFTVSLSNASYQTITVNYATADGTATIADNDYTSASNTITFNPDETSKPLAITVNNDTKYEANEDFYVNLSAPTNATISDNLGLGTITNDDAQPTISINDMTLSEGNSGTTSFGFAVTLSNTSYQTITVNYATADGSATIANNDYQATSNTLTFNPGDLTKPVSILINGDLTTEPNENFYVNLSTPTNSTISDGQGIGNITNDDGLPSISINDIALTEGNTGTTSFDFTVSLSNASSSTVSVEFATDDGTATTSDLDYIDNQGTVTFNPGEVSKPISILVNGDNKFESDEIFYIVLTNPASATISDAQGMGTILNDDNPPTIVINNVAYAEGDSLTTTFEFTVNLTSTTDEVISVNYSTSDGTATLTNNDYVSGSGVVQFNPGEDEKTIEVSVIGDYFTESNEVFYVDLSNPVNAVIADDQGIGTILNDDAGWMLSDSIPSVNDIKPGKHVKDGGSMTVVSNTDDGDIIYAFHGNKSKTFFSYTPGTPGVWAPLESIPYGYKSTDITKINRKKVAKGSALCWDGGNIIYATKGSTNEFWAYYINAEGLIPADTWIQKAFIPVPKKVKGGTSMISYDNKIYMLAGGQKATDATNFYCYNPIADTGAINTMLSPWIQLTKAPVTSTITGKTKAFKDGSCITLVGNMIYALKGGDKYNFLYAYDILGDTISGTPWADNETIPLVHPQYGKKTKVGDGAAMVTDGTALYAIKGKGKQDFWMYIPAYDTLPGVWTALDIIPKLNGYKKSVPKTGAALAYAHNEIYLLKGNNSAEYWRYIPAMITPYRVFPKTTAPVSQEKTLRLHNLNLSISSNPIRDIAIVNYTVPVTGKVSLKLHNTTGRVIEVYLNDIMNSGNYSMTLNASELAKGVYFLTYENNAHKTELKIVIQ